MALSPASGSSATPTPQHPLRPRGISGKDDELVYHMKEFREGLVPPPLTMKDGRSISNTNASGLRTASLANSAAPGSFSSNLKSINGPRTAVLRPDLDRSYSNDDPLDELNESGKRQAILRDKITKEIKIKTGSENLLEALLSKNAKQTKDQRLRVESELSSSNRKIADLKQQLEDEVESSKRPRPANPSRYSSLFQTSSLRAPSREGYSEEDYEDREDGLVEASPTFVLAEILQTLEVEGMQADYYITRANGLVDLFKRHPTLKYDLAWSIFGLRIQTMLLSESREVVAAGYRVTRHAIADRKSLRIIRELHTDTLVTLSLVKDSKATIEREQALKFVRAFLDVKDGAKELSNAVTRTLVAVAEHSEDRLRTMALLTLGEILIRNPALVIAAGGMAPLADALGEGTYPGSESMISAFLYITDGPRLRKLLSPCSGLEASFAMFTDSLSVHGHEERLKSSARSMAAIINSWPGLFVLAQGGFGAIRSLLLSLHHPSAFAQGLVLDLIFNVLHVKPPIWASGFLVGRRLTTYRRVANLHEEQDEDRTKVENEDDANRSNLIDHYTALVLSMLLQCGIIPILETVIQEAEDPTLERKATLLMTEILKLSDNILPPGLSARLQGLPELVSGSISTRTEADFRLATNMIYQLDSVNRTSERSESLGGQTSALPSSIKLDASHSKASGKSKLSVDMDEIQFRSILVDTQVVSTANYLKWRWDLINDIIEGPLTNPKRLDDALKSTKFLKRLMGFYRPFKYRFSDARNTKPNQRYVRTGCALIKCLLKSPEGVQELTDSKLLRQVAECLAQIDRLSGVTSSAPLFAPDRIADTLSSGYFNMLGALSSDPQGLLMLARWRMINMFYHILDLNQRDDVIKLLLGNMDFTINSHLRIVLSKALTACSKNIRIFTTKLLRQYATQVIHTRESQADPSVAYWAIRLLVTQLYDPEVEVSEVAVQILHEACNQKQYLEYVVKCRPALDHLGEIGAPLLLRFLSTSTGYQYLDDLDYITQEMDDWFLGRNEKYVTLVEASLNRAFAPDMERPRSIADEPFARQQLGTVPPHFYRELTRTTEGCRLLRDSGHFEDFVTTIKDFWAVDDDAETMLKVKGSLWAVGNVGSMELGALFLENSNIVGWIAKIVQHSAVMSMRGTAFFVLGLISRSLHGMEILYELGWDAATNEVGQSLGYVLPPSLEKLFTIQDELGVYAPPPPLASMERISPTIDTDNPVETRICTLVIELGNTVLSRRALGELHSIKTKRPELYRSTKLFRQVMYILECHNIRLMTRRMVLDLFDKDVMRQIILEENLDDEMEVGFMTAKSRYPI